MQASPQIPALCQTMMWTLQLRLPKLQNPREYKKNLKTYLSFVLMYLKTNLVFCLQEEGSKKQIDS